MSFWVYVWFYSLINKTKINQPKKTMKKITFKIKLIACANSEVLDLQQENEDQLEQLIGDLSMLEVEQVEGCEFFLEVSDRFQDWNGGKHYTKNKAFVICQKLIQTFDNEGTVEDEESEYIELTETPLKAQETVKKYINMYNTFLSNQKQ